MSRILICPHCSSDLATEDYETGMCPYCGTRLQPLGTEPADDDTEPAEAAETMASVETIKHEPEPVMWKMDGEWAVCPICGQSYDVEERPQYCERCVPDPNHPKYRYTYPKQQSEGVYVILKHTENNLEVHCGPGPTIIGRHITPGLETNRYVGRQHARITCADGACTVCDLNSVNGTKLNGRRLVPYEETPLHAGDVLEVDIERFTVGA